MSWWRKCYAITICYILLQYRKAIGLEIPFDFILTFWMVHEVPDQEKFFNQLKKLLAVEGKILIAEPKMHVTAEAFERTSDIAKSCGLQFIESPDIYFSRTALLGTGAIE